MSRKNGGRPGDITDAYTYPRSSTRQFCLIGADAGQGCNGAAREDRTLTHFHNLLLLFVFMLRDFSNLSGFCNTVVAVVTRRYMVGTFIKAFRSTFFVWRGLLPNQRF